MAEPVFFYDFNSPYAHLSAARVDGLLGAEVRWQPVAFAFVLRALQRTPWSFVEATRGPGVAECERRAAAYGLPKMCWPPGWPVGSYSLLPLRAALAAGEEDALKEFSHAAFARHFIDGLPLSRPKDIAAVAEAVGLDAGALLFRAGSPEIKASLQRATESALAAGLYGVPSVLIGDRFHWGDDSLDTVGAVAPER